MVSSARAVPLATNLPHATGKCRNNLLRSVDGHLLAGPDGGNPWGRVAAKAASRAAAALEGGRAGAQVGRTA